MDVRSKAEQDIIAAADCWARGVLQCDRLLDLTEQNLLDTVLAYYKFAKRNGLYPSHLPPPPNVPHEMDVEDNIPTVRYSEYSTVPSPPFGIPAVKIPSKYPIPDSDPVSDLDDIF